MKPGPSLKVGLVFDDSLDGTDGVAQYVKTLGGWLSGQGHQVRYLVGETRLSEWQGGRVYSLSKNLKVRFNGNHLTMPLFSKKADIRNVLAQEEFDVLHVMMPYSPLMAKRALKLAGQKTAVAGTFHIMPSGRLSGLGSRLLSLWLRRSLRRFDAVASVSQPAAQFAKDVYKIDSTVIPNPVNIRQFKNDAKIEDGKVVFLGRLVKRKGCQQLIKAYARAAAQLPGSRLVIAGDGPERLRLEALAKNLGLRERVEFLGYIKEDNKPALLGSAAIACFPSLYGESFGIVLIEAMAAGSGAVLGGNNPGYASVLRSSPGLLFDPADTAVFAAKLNDFLKDDKPRQAADAWQRQAVGQYDIAVVGESIIDMYNRAIAKKPAPRHN